MPEPDTSAILASGVVHVMGRPRSTRPSAERSCATTWRAKPTYTTADGGDTFTVATAGPLTVTGTVALIVVSSVIRTTMLAVPFVTPVTFPVGSTVATAAFDETHVTVSAFGLRSRAVIFADCPSSRVSFAGSTSTAGGSGLVDSHATVPTPARRASSWSRNMPTELHPGPPAREGSVTSRLRTATTRRLDSPNTTFHLAIMSLRLAPVFRNNDDSDATPLTGWGRRRTRA